MIIKVTNGFSESCFKVNPLKGEIDSVSCKKSDRDFFLLESEKTTFRIMDFPFKDKHKILKIIEGEVKSNPFLKEKEVVYRSVFFENREGMRVFAVIALKDDVENFEDKFDGVDSEVVAILRVLLWKGIKSGSFHFKTGKKAVFIKMEYGIPEVVRVLPSEQLPLSEEIKVEGVEKDKIPLFGSALQLLVGREVNFLKDEVSSFEAPLLKVGLFLSLSVLFLCGAFSFRGWVFKKKIGEIFRMEKELFSEKFPGTPSVDPLNQLKGMMSVKKGKGTVDSFKVLNLIGKEKSKSVNFLKIDISDGAIRLEGEAPDIDTVERFKNGLKEFSGKVTETVSLKGKVRFKIQGRF